MAKSRDAAISTGITMTFSGFVFELLDVNGGNFTREVYDVTHQGTTDWRVFAWFVHVHGFR